MNRVQKTRKEAGDKNISKESQPRSTVQHQSTFTYVKESHLGSEETRFENVLEWNKL